MKDISVGALPKLAGDVTTLNAIWPGNEAQIEAQLGYHSGRLSKGYSVALVNEPLKPADFQFSGTTMRSGGRYGLPGASAAEDAARPKVHDGILAERGAGGYADLQETVLRNIELRGAKRLAKVLPAIRHDADAPPNQQYPMGGGALQWTLIREVDCLIAVHVAPDGTATTPDFTVNLRRTGDYESWYQARRRLRSYLETA